MLLDEANDIWLIVAAIAEDSLKASVAVLEANPVFMGAVCRTLWDLDVC